MTAVLAILRRVPAWLWPLLAALAWGAWQRHDARTQTERRKAAEVQVATERAQAAEATASESMRRVLAQQEVIHAAEVRSAALARDAAAARAVADRVRVAAASYAASSATSSAAAAGDCQAAETVSGLYADLLGRAVERGAVLADLADRARAAGQACEAAYDSLTVKP